MDSLLPHTSGWRGADLAIDLGTANTLVVRKGAGVVFDEPTICCFQQGGTQVRLHSAGATAHAMVDKVTYPLRIARPLRSGVLSDMDAARELIRYATRGVRRSWRRRKLRALIGVPADATQAEQRGLLAAAHDAGLARSKLIAEPLMAAIGAGLDIRQPRGRMIVDCGAGTTEVAIISMGAICLSETVRVGGDSLDAALIDYFRLHHRFQIGLGTAERLKLQLKTALEIGRTPASTATIGGHSLQLRRPHTLAVPVRELTVVYEKHLEIILMAIKRALERTPAELSKDIHDDGIVITGGASMTGLLKRRITETTGVRARVAQDPLGCVARGLESVLESQSTSHSDYV